MARKRNKAGKTNNEKSKMELSLIILAVLVIAVIGFVLYIMPLNPLGPDNPPSINKMWISPSVPKAGSGVKVCADVSDDNKLKTITLSISNGAQLSAELPNVKSIMWCTNTTIEKAGQYSWQISVQDNMNQVSSKSFTRSVS